MMKKFLLFITALTISQSAWSQVPISTARTTPVGQTVTITGTVSNGAEIGVIRYMQDATAGIAIYDPTFANAVGRGDSVTLTGTMDLFNGLLEIKNVTYTLHGSNYTITPLVVTPTGIGPANEGELVQVNNVNFANQGGIFTNGTLAFTSATSSESGQIYLRSGHPLVGTTIPQSAVNLSGVSSQFSNSAQLLVRDANDIVIASTFYLTTGVQQSNITTTGFDLAWSTNTSGSTNVVYGSSPDNLTTHVGAGGNTSNHTISLNSLTAGEIYYVRSYSVNGADTAFSTVGAYSTVSTSTGQIEIFFNQVVDNGVSTGTNAQYMSGANLEAKIIQLIDDAQNTVDLAIYNISRQPIVSALAAAHNRGVRVRVIADDGTLNSALQNGNPPFNWFAGNANGLMHNKFIVVDAASATDAQLFMGSMNFTDGEIFDNYNSVMFIHDQSLAKAYEKEFDEMWGTNTATPGIFTRKLGSAKDNNTPHNFIVGGIEIQSYFSPSDATTAAISTALQSADSKIEFALLTFTRNDLRDDIINRYNAGVTVRGMIENINDTGGEYQTLLSAGVSMKPHTEQYLLHHKYGIVDEDAVNSDPLVIVGSHNWTSAAETNNDENTLIIHDATIANLYAQEFNARWTGLVTNTKNVMLAIEGFDVEILGNPARDVLRFSINNDDKYETVAVKLYNTLGQLLATEQLTNVAGTTQHQINISHLAAGNYIAVFEVDNAALGEQFVIAK